MPNTIIAQHKDKWSIARWKKAVNSNQTRRSYSEWRDEVKTQLEKTLGPGLKPQRVFSPKASTPRKPRTVPDEWPWEKEERQQKSA